MRTGAPFLLPQRSSWTRVRILGLTLDGGDLRTASLAFARGAEWFVSRTDSGTKRGGLSGDDATDALAVRALVECIAHLGLTPPTAPDELEWSRAAIGLVEGKLDGWHAECEAFESFVVDSAASIASVWSSRWFSGHEGLLVRAEELPDRVRTAHALESSDWYAKV